MVLVLLSFVTLSSILLGTGCRGADPFRSDGIVGLVMKVLSGTRALGISSLFYLHDCFLVVDEINAGAERLRVHRLF